ncbi:putative lipid II flippase FtsW [bacterium]|nr:putative lipid II flippase FtsW [bacterium]
MRRSINEKKVYRSFDIYLLMVTLILVFVGMIMVFSSSAVSAEHNYSDSYFYLKKQALFICVGLTLLFFTKKIPYKAYWKIVYPLLVLSFLALLFVLAVGHGGTSEGVHRWIRIGPFSFQPSELAKLTTVIFVAYALAKKGEKIKEFSKGFLPVIAISGIYILLILIQKDLGGALTLAIIVMLMLFVAGTRLAYIFGAFLAALPVLYFAIFSVEYRRKRIMAFLDPWQHQMDSGFQVIQSFVAFQSGGVTGVGLGDGKQKLFYLPEAHTDFIFSVIGEELGLLGVLLVITLFTVFIFRGLLITLKTKDLFGMYLAFGITALIGVQAFFNMAVVMGLLPTKGLALPFISYGGSSLMVSLMAVGILLNISTADPHEA